MEELKDKLVVELKDFFGEDLRRINHALKVLAFCEEIMKGEKTEDNCKDIVVASAVLHDIGIKEGERLFNSSAPKYQEEFGPPIAREILTKLGMNPLSIQKVCDIIAHHHHPARYLRNFSDEDPLPFKILIDADLLVNALEGEVKLHNGCLFFFPTSLNIALREGCLSKQVIEAEVKENGVA